MPGEAEKRSGTEKRRDGVECSRNHRQRLQGRNPDYPDKPWERAFQNRTGRPNSTTCLRACDEGILCRGDGSFADRPWCRRVREHGEIGFFEAFLQRKQERKAVRQGRPSVHVLSGMKKIQKMHPRSFSLPSRAVLQCRNSKIWTFRVLIRPFSGTKIRRR